MNLAMTAFVLTSLGVALIVLRAAYLHLTSTIRDIPGPFLAKFTNLWRLLDYYKGTQIDSQQRLHEKLGSAVRIGPNIVSLSDPSLLRTIYSTRGEFLKSDFYSVNDAVQDGHRIQNLFSTRDKEFHAKYMRPIHKLFSPQHIESMEPMCNKALVSLCNQLEARFIKSLDGELMFDLADWMEYFSWDMNGEMTFSKDMGFLKAGCDHSGIINATEQSQRYFAIVGQMPWLDMWLGKNAMCPIKIPTFSGTAGFCVERLRERMSIEKPKGQPTDFLDHYLVTKEQSPDLVTDKEVIGYLILNVLAGADTTAVVMKTIVYHVLSNPSIYARLRAELDAANLSFPATFEQTKALPYLDAVLKESMRLHPVIGGILERVVPDSGLTLPDGRFIAPRTIVGMNPWVIHRNKDIYGQDVDAFRPDRWLRHDFERQPAFKSRLKRMKDTDFTFGAGNRVCLGKYSAHMQILKTIATLFWRQFQLLFKNAHYISITMKLAYYLVSLATASTAFAAPAEATPTIDKRSTTISCGAFGSLATAAIPSITTTEVPELPLLLRNALISTSSAATCLSLGPALALSSQPVNGRDPNTYDVMVWLAAIDGAHPISATGSAIATITINNANYKLYYGLNGDTKVYSFVATSPIYSFSGDVKAFFNYITPYQKAPSNYYVTFLQAGTEPFSGSNVAFTTSAYKMSVV
ncbi:hypothetical protein SUNI508_06294 [Seiridium unicorne]|uniref:Cytochrome P450 n=1 Tax=Seiridium unicorne TaxID=138068 RepID=A0ABR2V1T7_9PEZI